VVNIMLCSMPEQFATRLNKSLDEIYPLHATSN
jgi:hypothetical protein